MNGATALDCPNTISSPKSTKTITIGISQYFFSSRRNCQNSIRTRRLAMVHLPLTFNFPLTFHFPLPTSNLLLIHPPVMLRAAIPRRMRHPTRPSVAFAGHRIAADRPPDQPHRRKNQHERQGEDDAGVDVAEDDREAPPDIARPLQQCRPKVSEGDQCGSNRAEDFGA